MSDEIELRLSESSLDFTKPLTTESISEARTSTISEQKNKDAISQKNCFNKLLFLWSTKSMFLSNKKTLKIKHLSKGENNKINDLFIKLYNEYHKNYSFNYELERNIEPHNFRNENRKTKMCPLFMSILKSNLNHILFVFFLSLLVVLSNYFQIQLLRDLIIMFGQGEEINYNYLNNSVNTSNNLNMELSNYYHYQFKKKIFMYAFLFLGNKLVLIFLQNHVSYQSQILGVNAGNMLTALIYEKLLRSSSIYTGEISEGQLLNYLQGDIDTVGFVFYLAPITIVVPIQFTIYIIMLFSYFGYSFFFGIIIFITLFLIAWIIQRLYIINQRALLKNKDKRLKITSYVLQILKVIKLYVWENEFIKRINKERESELRSLNKIQNVSLLSGFVHRSIPLFLNVASIGSYTLLKGKLPLENLLASIEIFDSMAVPLYRLPIFVTSLLNCLISMGRLEKFLNTKDFRKTSKQDKTLKEKNNIDIKFSNCDFGIFNPLTNTNKILLHKLDLEIQKGDLIAVLGETGSGKTCLINAILNYLDFLPRVHSSNFIINNKSQVYNIINGTISYASQNPWILKGTVRENIVFFNNFDKERYQEALKLCQLIDDLCQLPGGDQTEISSNGTNISGGQKARISLARAIYKDADIYLFDDPISSVDNINSEKIFKNVLIKHLKNKTRILVKHDLQNLNLFNRILYIKKGKITFNGSYSEFIKNKIYTNLLEEENNNIKNKNEINQNIIKLPRKESFVITDNRKFSLGNEDEKYKKGKLIKEEELKNGGISKNLYKEFLKLMGGKMCFIKLLIISLFSQLSNVGGFVWLMIWSKNDKNDFYNFLIYAEIGMASLFFLFLKEFFFSRILLVVSRKLHNKILYKIIHAPINLFHDIVPIGQIINRLTSDLDKCKLILKLMSQLLRSGFILLSSVVVCAYYNKYSLISGPIMFIFGIIITSFYISAGRNLNRLDGISRAPLVTCFSETFSGARIIKSFKREENLKERLFNYLNDYYYVISYKFGATNWNLLFLELSSYLYILFIVVFVIIFYNKFNSEAIVLMIKYSLSFSQHMLNSFDYVSNLEKSMVSFERCHEYTDIVQERSTTKKERFIKEDWPKEGKISIKNYSCKYRPETEIVLNDINAEIKGGEKIGIVGKSGSGKSTLILSLYRIIEAYEGSIYIDDVDISEIRLDLLRNAMSIVPQESTIFEGTVRDNVDPLRKHNDDEIYDILNELSFFDFLNENVEPIFLLNYKLREFGNNISLGKKQILCFARAILKKSKIIFLDEATATLDQKNEEIINKSIKKHFSNSTVLIIAHRLNNVLNCDRVMVFDEGNLVEFEKPKELLKHKTSLFYKLYSKENMV